LEWEEERAMTSTERLWLNGFTTVSEALANDQLAIEEVRQAFEEGGVSDEPWLSAWKAGVVAGIGASFGS
jgi:hypothetical protein